MSPEHCSGCPSQINPDVDERNQSINTQPQIPLVHIDPNSLKSASSSLTIDKAYSFVCDIYPVIIQ